MRTQATDNEPTPGPRKFRLRSRQYPKSPEIAALGEDADFALEHGKINEGLLMLRRLWHATFDPWNLTRIGCVLYRNGKFRRARVALECAAGMHPFHVLTGSLLIQVARAQGDQVGMRQAWLHTILNHGEELPPEPW